MMNRWFPLAMRRLGLPLAVFTLLPHASALASDPKTDPIAAANKKAKDARRYGPNATVTRESDVVETREGRVKRKVIKVQDGSSEVTRTQLSLQHLTARRQDAPSLTVRAANMVRDPNAFLDTERLQPPAEPRATSTTTSVVVKKTRTVQHTADRYYSDGGRVWTTSAEPSEVTRTTARLDSVTAYPDGTHIARTEKSRSIYVDKGNSLDSHEFVGRTAWHQPTDGSRARVRNIVDVYGFHQHDGGVGQDWLDMFHDLGVKTNELSPLRQRTKPAGGRRATRGPRGPRAR